MFANEIDIEEDNFENDETDKACLQNSGNYFDEFTSKTSIYGIKYLVEPGRTVAERCYWIIFICVSSVIATVLIAQTWGNWNYPPVVISENKGPTPLWQIPFPAITICTEIKTRQRMYNFTEHYHKMLEHFKAEENKMTPDELQLFSDSSLICDNHLHRQGNETASHEVIKHLNKIAPPQDEVFLYCKYTSSFQNCSNLFSPVLTEDGVCYTFNMLNRRELFTDSVYFNGDHFEHEKVSKEWNLNEGYSKTAPRDTFPRRAMSGGTKTGLFVLLRAYEYDLDYICRGPVQGFKVLLHHPAEIPRIGTRYLRAPLNHETVVVVKPNMIRTSPDLRKYNPYKRGCFFSEERQLKFFQIYTQHNCEVECLANFTLAQCGCVAYHMPHEKSTKICGSGSNDCVFKAEMEQLYQQTESEMSRYNSGDQNFLSARCGCIPSCTSITYDSEISQADLNWPKVFEAFGSNVSEFPGIHMSRLTVFFKDLNFISSERKELNYSGTEFLAICGGLLGLFTGFSIFSVAEIFYYLSFRLMCNIRKHGKEFWSEHRNE